jgi:hypothetical protein
MDSRQPLEWTSTNGLLLRSDTGLPPGLRQLPGERPAVLPAIGALNGRSAGPDRSDRPGAVAQIGECTERKWIRGIVYGTPIVDKVALQIQLQVLRSRLMHGVESGIRDADAKLCRIRCDLISHRPELRSH